MILDLDIWRTANLLVNQHGKDTPIDAAMLEKGDLDGYAVWKRVVKAVEALPGNRGDY